MNNRLVKLKTYLWILATFGIVAIIVRILGGLGASTNLTDSMPWGIWKILNMVAGAALATGGFILAAVVHVFKIKKYKPFLRPAILIAFLGYGSSLFALLWDIGLPQVFYNPFFYWNHHSFLFEVFWCVSLYFTITIFEIGPVILEKFHMDKIKKWLQRISTPVIILGITFSTLHHTSLGSLFLVMPTRLHALWFTNWIPVLFFLSAIGAGIMMVVLVKLSYSYLYNREEDITLVADLARIAAVILSVYFMVKLADLIYHHKFYLLFSGQWESYVFLTEMLISTIIPALIIFIPRFRLKISGLVLASVMAVSGLAMNRIDVGIIGLLRTSETGYFPSLLEICLSLGVISGAVLIFLFIIENFNIFAASSYKSTPVRDDHRISSSFAGIWKRNFLTGFARFSLLVAIALSLSAGIFYGNISRGVPLKKSPVHAPLGFDTTRSVLVINGDIDDDYVKFKHQFHVEKLGHKEACKLCHHLDLPNDNATACWKCHRDMNLKTPIFNHDFHVRKLNNKFSCNECHNPERPKNLENSKDCRECHAKNMNNLPAEGEPFNFAALSYKDAFHGMCITCHKKQDEKLATTKLAECLNCHKEAWQKKFELGDSSNFHIVEWEGQKRSIFK